MVNNVNTKINIIINTALMLLILAIYMQNINEQLSYIIQSFHMLLDFFYCFYIFIFPIEYDIYFVWFVLFIILHWCILYNECLISYVEKKLLNPDYILASDTKNIPHHKTFYNESIVHIIHLSIVINLLFIFYRSESNIKKLMVTTALTLGCICVILL
jgi:hypothetical protein